MTLKHLAVLVVLTLPACGASSTQIHGPDGDPDWYAITCRRSASNCYEEAGEVCPNGYTIAENDGGVHYVATATQTNAYVIPTYNGRLLIKCK